MKRNQKASGDHENQPCKGIYNNWILVLFISNLRFVSLTVIRLFCSVLSIRCRVNSFLKNIPHQKLRNNESELFAGSDFLPPKKSIECTKAPASHLRYYFFFQSHPPSVLHHGVLREIAQSLWVPGWATFEVCRRIKPVKHLRQIKLKKSYNQEKHRKVSNFKFHTNVSISFKNSTTTRRKSTYFLSTQINQRLHALLAQVSHPT